MRPVLNRVFVTQMANATGDNVIHKNISYYG